MKPRVSLARCADYEPDRIQAALLRAVEGLGGASSFVRTGDRVLIKANMLSAKPPEKAVTTHPEVVRAAIRLVRDAGGIAVVGDSQAIGGFPRIAELTGIGAVAAEEGASLVELSEARTVRGEGTFRRFEISSEVLEADKLINLPKAKTHGQMLLTLAVKNLFGCVPGKRKAQWHFRSGVDRDAFATMLVELCEIVKPALSIVDAVVGMEGNGPGSGTPKQIGLIAASADPFALDMVLSEVLNVPSGRLPTTKAAVRKGLAPKDVSGIDIAGDFDRPSDAGVGSFRLPAASSAEWTIPEPLRKLLKDALTSKPRIDPRVCERCLACQDACPAGVISERGDKMSISYRECIRCFCCQEVCPVGAVELVEGWLLRYLG